MRHCSTTQDIDRQPAEMSFEPVSGESGLRAADALLFCRLRHPYASGVPTPAQISLSSVGRLSSPTPAATATASLTQPPLSRIGYDYDYGSNDGASPARMRTQPALRLRFHVLPDPTDDAFVRKAATPAGELPPSNANARSDGDT